MRPIISHLYAVKLNATSTCVSCIVRAYACGKYTVSGVVRRDMFSGWRNIRRAGESPTGMINVAGARNLVQNPVGSGGGEVSGRANQKRPFVVHFADAMLI